MKNKISVQDKLQIIRVQIEGIIRLNKIADTMPFRGYAVYSSLFEARQDNRLTNNDIDRFFEI